MRSTGAVVRPRGRVSFEPDQLSTWCAAGIRDWSLVAASVANITDRMRHFVQPNGPDEILVEKPHGVSGIGPSYSFLRPWFMLRNAYSNCGFVNRNFQAPRPSVI